MKVADVDLGTHPIYSNPYCDNKQCHQAHCFLISCKFRRLLVQALLSKDFLTRLEKEGLAFSKQLQQRRALASLLTEVAQGRKEARDTLSQLIKVVPPALDELCIRSCPSTTVARCECLMLCAVSIQSAMPGTCTIM